MTSLKKQEKHMQNKLGTVRAGDVFSVGKGMYIFAQIPERFVYITLEGISNTFSDKLKWAYIVAGNLMTCRLPSASTIAYRLQNRIDLPDEYGCVSFDLKKLEEAIQLPNLPCEFDTSIFIGDYVICTPNENEDSDWRNRRQIWASKLNDGKYDPKRRLIKIFHNQLPRIKGHIDIEIELIA